jgi:hypothetical protein
MKSEKSPKSSKSERPLVRTVDRPADQPAVRKSSRGDDLVAGAYLAELENLIDELIKPAPQEARIKAYMSAAGLTYSEDPIERMNHVLEALEGAQGSEVKGGNHGRNI